MRTSIAMLLLALRVLATPPQGETIRCGIKLAPCPLAYHCVADSPQCADLNRCLGHCEFNNEYSSCGGTRIKPKECAGDEKCYPDPRVPGADSNMPGICVSTEQPRCNGFVGDECPDGLTCHDLPNDGCDPMNGGADCIGVCL